MEYELSLKFVADRMFTKAGKRLAIQRAAFMDAFYSRLEEEMKGVL